MTDVSSSFLFRRYRVLRKMILALVAIALLQILSGGLWRILKPDIGQPTRWIVSYTGVDNQPAVEEIAAPMEQQSIEHAINGGLRVEMDFPECRQFSQYRFWVGPWATDDTDRQPAEWTLFVRDDEGGWMRADDERMKGPYRNSAWYAFPLHASKGCIRQVRWEITKIAKGQIFRLYRFELYTPGLVSFAGKAVRFISRFGAKLK
jgi:hypothetical protein